MNRRTCSLLLGIIMVATLLLSSTWAATDTKHQDMALKGKDVYTAWYMIHYSSYQYYITDYVSPYRSPIQHRRNSFTFNSLLLAWRTATFDLKGTLDYADKELGYYEAYLYNLILDESSENIVGDFSETMSDALSSWNTNSKQLGASAWKKLCKLMDSVVTDGSVLDKSTAIPETAEGKAALAKQLGSLPELKNICELFDDIETLMSYYKTVFELLEHMTQAEAILRTPVEVSAVFKDMATNSTTSVASAPGLQIALKEMGKLTDGSLTADEVRAFLVGKTTAQELLKLGVKKIQSAVVKGAGAYGLSVQAGQAIGKLTCSALFNTDKVIENYYCLNALYELETLLQARVKVYENAFNSSPTTENARRFIAGCKMLYKLYLEGVDGYVKYIEANHMKGTLNELWPSITDEDYGRLVSDAEALKKSIRYALEYSEQIAQSSYYDVLSEIDQKTVTDSGMEPVIPLITEEQNAAYLQQVESGSQLYADFVVTKDTTLAGDVETFGDVIFKSGTLDLNGHVLLTHGSMTVSGGTANLNAGTLTVKGDLLQSGGTMYCNKGTLNVGGDYRIQSATTNDDGEIIYNLSYGVLKMSKEPDRINVGGSFVTQGSGNSSSVLTAGVMTVKGDFTQLNHNGWGDNFAASGTHKVVLDGQGVQTVSFQNSSSFFNELEAGPNTELHWKGYISMTSPMQHDLVIHENGLRASSKTLELNGHTLKVIGSLVLETGSTINLNGGTLTVTENFLQPGGTMYCNKGTLNVGGDYRIQSATTNDDGEIIYNLSSGVLKMSKEPDRINVGGSFVTQGNGNSSSILTAGVMTVKGDFTQLESFGWGDNFAASGTHKVVLDGQGVQTVSFQNSSSFFNELEITKPLETGYVFSRMPCWKTLTYVSREPNINVIGGDNAPACQVDGQTLTVTCDRACVAAYKDADGNYVRLMPTANADGSYSYTLPKGVSEVTVAVRGDLDGDGKLTAKEARQVMTAVTRTDGLDALQMLCADLNGDGKISAMEARQILSAVTNSAAVKW